MRKPNSIPEFADQRSGLLLQNFRESIARQSRISAERAFKEAVEAPAPRFWVSEARATRVIALMLKGEDPTEGMYPEKREMYMEIFRRVRKLKGEEPSRPLGDIVFEIVNSPAPRHYMSWLRAKTLITQGRMQNAQDRMQNAKCKMKNITNT